MPYECIDPEKRDGICEMMEASIEKIAAFESRRPRGHMGGPVALELLSGMSE